MSPAAAKTAPQTPDFALCLPETLDLPAAQQLAGELNACRGAPVTLDASQVKRMGALALQVLLSARKTWAADGQPLAIRSPSPPFSDALALFGAAPFGGPSGE